MELSLSLRTAYFTALSGNITYNSKVVPVYDVFAVPEQAQYPYILLSTQVANQRLVQRCKIYDASILIDIVTGNSDPIGREPSEVIAAQVENIVIPSDYSDLTLQGYSIGDTYREQDFEETSVNDTNYIYRKLIRYNHLITKN